MSLLNNLSIWCVEHANTLIDAFPITSKPLVFITFFVLMNTLLATYKLRNFSNPKRPKLSLIAREIASILNAICGASILLTLLYFFTLFTLAFFAFSLDNNLRAGGFFNLIAYTLKQLWTVMHQFLPSLISGAILGAISGAYLKYFQIPDWERDEGLGDVHDIASAFNKLNGFDPRPYFKIEKGCFVGASTEKKLVYIPWQKMRETHIQVLGASGSGKGVIMSLITYQSILNGEGLIWFDPKFDRFSPRIIEDAARKAKKDFYLINLNPEQPPQLNPLAGASAYEIEELLVTAFDLISRGTDGDYHRGKDEDAAILASKIAIEKNALSISELIKVCRNIEEITNQENFWRKLTKLGGLNAKNTNDGINLEEVILSGAVIYIIGSTDNERVKMLQKLLLVRINQIIKKKDRFKVNAPICIVLDEFKYLLSPTALSGLGAIRDFNAHCILAHQSLGDLDSCPGVTYTEAKGAVLDNTVIKIIYRIADSDHAENLSKNSGKKRVFIEQTGKSIDKNNQQQGGWKESNVPLIDPDLITHLPMPTDRKGQASVGVIFGAGISKVFFTGHIPISSEMPKVQSNSNLNVQLKTDEESINDLI